MHIFSIYSLQPVLFYLPWKSCLDFACSPSEFTDILPFHLAARMELLETLPWTMLRQFHGTLLL